MYAKNYFMFKKILTKSIKSLKQLPVQAPGKLKLQPTGKRKVISSLKYWQNQLPVNAKIAIKGSLLPSKKCMITSKNSRRSERTGPKKKRRYVLIFLHRIMIIVWESKEVKALIFTVKVGSLTNGLLSVSHFLLAFTLKFFIYFSLLIVYLLSIPGREAEERGSDRGVWVCSSGRPQTEGR